MQANEGDANCDWTSLCLESPVPGVGIIWARHNMVTPLRADSEGR